MADGRLVNLQPRPAALIAVSDDELAERLAALFPTSRRIDPPVAIRQEEWDVLVTDRGAETFRRLTKDSRLVSWEASAHLFVISFVLNGSSTVNTNFWSAGPHPMQVLTESSVATQLHVPNLGDPVLAGLVDRDLVPQAKGRTRHETLVPSGDLQSAQPFLETTEPAILAGSFLRPGGEAELWVLPADVRLHEEWVKAALRHWRVLAPERFQHLPGWEQDPRWQTAHERLAWDAVADLDAERQRVLDVLDTRRAELVERADQLRAEADAGPRRLLTAQGEDLEDAVADALRSLGFTVRQMDAERPEGDRLEDLRVSDPDADGWEGLVEVRGYGSGNAKVTDLGRFARYRERYVLEHGQTVSACWYVVNQQAGRDPAGRPPPLAANEPDVAVFAADNGLVVDTATLFALLRSVEAGEVRPFDARRTLRTSTGRLCWSADGQATDEQAADQGAA